MKNKLIKFVGIATLLGFILALVAGCVTPTAPTAAPQAEAPKPVEAPKVIKIGFLTPLTGTSAALGKQVLDAAKMLVDLINDAHPESKMFLAEKAGLPNLNGAKIELVVADHKSDATVAVAEAKRLITEEKVVGLTGEYTSALIKAIAPVTEQYEIPFLAAGSAVTLTDGSIPLKWFFRFGVTDATYIKDTFEFMKMLNDTQNAGIKTVAFFSEDSEFGANIVKQEYIYAKEFNFEVVEDIKYPANATNLTAEVLKLKKADPDVLVMASFVSDALLFMNTAQEQKYSPRLIIGQRGGFIQPDYLKAMGSKNDYILTTGSWSADLKSPVGQELIKLYPEKYSGGAALSDAHVKDIACLHFLAMAINQAGTTESKAVAAALRNLKYDMATLVIAWKGIAINEFGQNTLSNGIVAQFKDGKYQTVYPADVAAMKAVYPMPPWDQK